MRHNKNDTVEAKEHGTIAVELGGENQEVCQTRKGLFPSVTSMLLF